jgi:hypothetical protein
MLVDHVIDRGTGSRGEPDAKQAEDEDIEGRSTFGRQ